MVLLFLFWLLCVGWAGVLSLYISTIRSYGCIYMSMYIYIYMHRLFWDIES